MVSKQASYLFMFIFWLVMTSYPAFSSPEQELDFSSLRSPSTVSDSKALFWKRARLVKEYWAKRSIGDFGMKSVTQFYSPIMAKMSLSRDLESANMAILDGNTMVYSDIGTNFAYAGIFCKRKGDYDFMLHGLVNMVGLFGHDSNLIWPYTRWKLLYYLLSQNGYKKHLRLNLGICGRHDETENHILMTETSRYLTNQFLIEDGIDWWEFDNGKNGFHAWMLKHLRKFLIRGFSEYNSKPYQGYAIMPVANLYNHARDPRVKLAARMVLDYLSAVFAVQSNKLRRSVPFRRQKKYRNEHNLFRADAESARFAVLAGNTDVHSLHSNHVGNSYYGEHVMLSAALGDYRVPGIILDLMIRKDHNTYYQRFRHEGAEVFWSSKNFLISGGGIYVNKLDAGTGENDGWTMPTTLIPTLSMSAHRKDFIRIKGHKKHSGRHNTCVAPNFACGLDPVIPDTIPEACKVKEGNWTFLDLGSERCSVNWGIHVAVYSKKCDSWRCRRRGKRFGFIEVAEIIPDFEFDEFMLLVKMNNEGRRFRSTKTNSYRTLDADEIRFIPVRSKMHEFRVVSINGKSMQKDIRKWPHAKGDIMNSDGKGLITIRNSYLGKTLVLDMRNPLNPKRYFTTP